MKITRIIHPIGQGGFYSETLKEGDQEVTVVYDCGGNSKPFMENYLKNYFPKIDEDPTKQKKTIDAVFISHMHEDHVNGLIFLLENYNVRYLFLPQLNLGELLEVYVYNSKKSNSVGNQLLSIFYANNQDVMTFRDTLVYKVPHSNEDGLLQLEISENDLNIQQNNHISHFSRGMKIHYNRKWLFIPYNPPRHTILNGERRSFYNYFRDILNGGKEFGINDIKSIVKKIGKRACKEVYKEYFGSHNSYSMTLFSGAVLSDIENYHNDYYYYIPWPHLPFNSPNCLYMGDFEAKDDVSLRNLRNFYNPIWESISSLQVPHHGSRNNHNPLLYNFARLGFISVGEKNRYHHPNVDTLIGIKEMYCEPILVTENLNTIKLFHASDKS